MQPSIDWGTLYTQGRCKNLGVPWSEEEASAVFELQVPAEYVRRGALTLETYEQMKAEDEGRRVSGKVYISQLKRDDLMRICRFYEVSVPDEVTRAVMIEELTNKGVPLSLHLTQDGLPVQTESQESEMVVTI